MAYDRARPNRYGDSIYAIHQTSPVPPSSKESYVYPYAENRVPRSGAQRFRPGTWSKRSKIMVASAVVVIIVLIAIIVGAVVGTEVHNKYPDYSTLTYNHADTFETSSFFNNFQYWNTYDPAQGFVHYDSEADATNPIHNTTFMSPDAAYVQVDNKEAQSPTGRHSARVQSLKQYNDGLFMFDVKHSPFGCATWPAIWFADAYHWPTNGEIDVIEAVNQATSGVQSTLHTTKGCTMKVKRKQTGSVVGTDCWNVTDDNNGCGVKGPSSTYGQTFNQAGGGVYATELRAEGIRIWFFPRASLPGDVATSINTGSSDATHPNPANWPEPLADFPSTDCDIGSHFRNQSIIVNIDLCGQWAGRDYNVPDNCPGNCEQFVTSNPSAFNEAYWALGRFKVYQA